LSDVLVTAADKHYGYHALNLIGSVKRNSDVFERIEVFDLGLEHRQRELLAAVPGVVVRTVPAFVPHWSQCFTWKPWTWQQVDADRVFYVDAGATVLRSLAPALAQVDELGYFFVSQGNRLDDIVPADYFELYGLQTTLAARPYVAAGILGFDPRSRAFDRVFAPTYADCLEGRNLGYSPAEVMVKNRGLGFMQDPPLRNCPQFRWDQTVLNIHLALELPDARIGDLDEYGGWRSRRDHPNQVIWNHRRRGDLLYLPRVPYRGRTRVSGTIFGAFYALRWWFKLRERFRRKETYILKARSLVRRSAAPPIT